MKHASYILYFPFFILLILFVASCQDKRISEESSDLPNQVLKNLTLQETMSGKSLYVLKAVEATVCHSEERIEVKQPWVIFYDEGGKIIASLTAQKGVMWTKTQDLGAYGEVCLETPDSTILYTDSLVWSNARREVYTDALVTITTPHGTMRGEGLVSDAQLKKIEILSEVSGTSNYEFRP